MTEVVRRESLLEVLNRLPDPRGRHGRRYRMGSMLACLILAALNGETSLRGMWLWACEHSDLLRWPLGLWDTGRVPALETFRLLLKRLDSRALLRAFNEWLEGLGREGVSVDEKVLRGTRREGEAPLKVVTAFGRQLGRVIDERKAEGEDQTAAALAVLGGMPLEGRVVTLDAGLMVRPVVEMVVQKGGPTWGRSRTTSRG